jgi:segregation and condensation protein B
MSLKARIEAVIYAAEEPVTLQQLAAIFRDEALASRAARLTPQGDPEEPTEADIPTEAALAESAESSEQRPEHPSAPASDEKLPSEPAAQDSADSEVATPDYAGEPQPRSDVQPAPAEPPYAESEPAVDQTEGAAASLAETPSAEDEKKAARARDREVRDEIRRLVDELIAEYAASDRGLEIREVAGGFRMATRAEYHDAVRAFVKSLKPPMKLSLQALETLAVIAYKQPITAPEIGEIRGVDSAGVLGSLVARKLITTAGRKQVIGRPILYKTTKEFLLRFGLKDLNELPSIEEFEKMATELAETEQEAAETAEAEKELPFAQNEMAEVEEAVAGPFDPKEPAPPMDEPEPTPEPPIGEPPAEPNPAPTTEQDASAE